METVNCHLCGDSRYRAVFEARERLTGRREPFRLVRCARCGFVYLNPRPAEQEIMSYYPEGYHERSRLNAADLERVDIWGIPWKEAMRIKAEPLLRYRRSGSVLDVGCGDGMLIKYLHDQGWEAAGVEPGRRDAEYVARVLGLRVFNGRVEDADFTPGSFDVVSLMHVLEHLHQPRRTLQAAAALLKDDGVMIIEVPNFASLSALLFGRWWYGIAVPLHLSFFTPSTLKALLRACDLDVVETRCLPERTKYAGAYSDSVRFLLSDLGLYPAMETAALAPGAAPVPAEKRSLRSALKRALKPLECAVFASLENSSTAAGYGSNLLMTARKAIRA